MLTTLGFGQTVEEDMLSLRQAYEKNIIVQRVTYSFEAVPGAKDTITEKMGWVVCKRKSSFTFLDAGTTIIANDSITVMIDDMSKSLVVLPNYKKVATSSLSDKIKASIEQADSVRLLSDLSDGLRGYRFWMTDRVEVVLDIIFQTSNYMIESISTTYPKGTGLNLRVSYEVKELPKKLGGKDRLSEYVIWDKGVFTPAPSYQQYEFVNGWGE